MALSTFISNLYLSSVEVRIFWRRNVGRMVVLRRRWLVEEVGKRRRLLMIKMGRMTRNTKVVYSESDLGIYGDEEDDKRKKRRGRGRRKKTEVEDQKEGVGEEHKGNGQKDSKGVLTAKRGRKGRKKAEANGVGGLEFEKKEMGGLDGEDEKSECNEGSKMRMKKGNNKGVRNGKEVLKVSLLRHEESLDQEKKKVSDLKEAHENGEDLDNNQRGRRGVRPRALKVSEQEKPKANSGNCNCKACLRLDVPVTGLKNEKVYVTKEDKVDYSRYLLQGLLPFLKQLNEEKEIRNGHLQGGGEDVVLQFNFQGLEYLHGGEPEYQVELPYVTANDSEANH
ncbi:hypothetical protein PanWU01x14_098110 [Parasponia andersonii]|uniref:Uncharacterized protein n=1 Tax=Parasponia andersonii TaxID=3476 RepID=A0A2P5D4M5_PARAD|nr:hypothetical protein PanWU01x14_098110 [Parasponia andersonii]